MPRVDLLEVTGSSRGTPTAEEECSRRTAAHAHRVMQHAVRLAEALDLTAAFVNDLRAASILHDVGKNAIPARILNKTGPLTPSEWDLIRLHPRLGAGLAERFGYGVNVATMIEHHHERWTGGGYPAGLQGLAIPLGSRIIAVADVFDALTSARSYCGALQVEHALAVMRTEAGIFLDPDLFAIFERQINPGVLLAS